MGLATIMLVVFLLTVFYLMGKRNAWRRRMETPKQQAERKRKDDIAVIHSVLDDR